VGEPTETVLVVEDDRSIRCGLAMNFERKGMRVLTAADGEEGMRKALDMRPDLVILDIMLPGLNGLEILTEIRKRDAALPVLVLSARDTTDNKIEGLDLGADDYMTKPFELRELMARAEVMLRRRRKERTSEPAIRFGDVAIDPAARTVTVRGKPVGLSAKEFDLLCLLARSPGRPFTREIIIDRVWGWGFSGTERTVDNYILSLRQKLEADPEHPRHLKTVRQVGYKLER
jgi:DNA-binding response OmpR family regulator